MDTHTANLRLAKKSAMSSLVYVIRVAPVDDTRRSGEDAGEVVIVEEYRDVLGTPHPLANLEDVHEAYMQMRLRFNLPVLGRVDLHRRVDDGIGQGRTTVLADGSWSHALTIA
jgi:hypothetical protein